MINHVVLMGKVIGKYKLPYMDINAAEVEIDGEEFIIHFPENLWDQLPIDESLIGVAGHLYHIDGYIRVMADKLTILKGE